MDILMSGMYNENLKAYLELLTDKHSDILVTMAITKTIKLLRNVVARDISSYTPPSQQN